MYSVKVHTSLYSYQLLYKAYMYSLSSKNYNQLKLSLKDDNFINDADESINNILTNEKLVQKCMLDSYSNKAEKFYLKNKILPFKYTHIKDGNFMYDNFRAFDLLSRPLGVVDTIKALKVFLNNAKSLCNLESVEWVYVECDKHLNIRFMLPSKGYIYKKQKYLEFNMGYQMYNDILLQV